MTDIDNDFIDDWRRTIKVYKEVNIDWDVDPQLQLDRYIHNR